MAAIQKNVFETPQKSGYLRPFDASQDMRPVADLVEMCFADSIDPDGRRYLNQMRSAAKNGGLIKWAVQFVEPVSMPLAGFIYEEDGQLIGNLSLISFSRNGRRLYLIANVAVHPRFRRRGIARELTQAALEHARKRNAVAAWLHVREENEPALRLYRSMGFEEKDRRTTWHNRWGEGCAPLGNGRTLNLPGGYQLGTRRDVHWLEQKNWLHRMYPAALSWHFNINIGSYQPSLWGSMVRFATGNGCTHWSVQKDGNLYGVITRQPSPSYADNLWLALPENYDELAVQALLVYAQKRVGSRRPLSLDLPARMAEDGLCKAGFNLHQTLIWMSVPFE